MFAGKWRDSTIVRTATYYTDTDIQNNHSPSKHETFIQRCTNVGPASQTLDKRLVFAGPAGKQL